MTAINGILCEDLDCLSCMMADMDSFVSGNGGFVYEPEAVAAERMRFMAPGTRSGNGVVRSASPRMIGFLRKLLSERDVTAIKIYPGQYITEKDIAKNSWQGAKALIDKLLNAPSKPNQSVRMATKGQINFINALNAQIITPEYKLSESDISTITFVQVNEVLDCLRTVINAEKDIYKAKQITEGMYRVNSRIFKVQKSKQSGHLYAKELVDGKFQYAQGAMGLIKADGVRMTLAEAKEYGKKTGQCCQCGRELTVQESIDAGIGPVCASKF